VGSVSPPFPFEKHAACSGPCRVLSMSCLMTGGPNKKIKKKISDSSRVYKSRNSASPRIVEHSGWSDFSRLLAPPPLSIFVLSWPWCACLNVGVNLDHPETTMWTALLCDLLLSAEIKAMRIHGAVPWPSCCRKVKSRWIFGAPGGVDFCRLLGWLRDY
jgi:hypothetical protein